MMKNNYMNLIGIANRAGKCSFGEEIILSDVRKQKAKLVLIANDIGEATKKKLTDKCETYQVPLIMLREDRTVLSQAVGKSQRVAVAILDVGFANKIQTLLGE